MIVLIGLTFLSGVVCSGIGGCVGVVARRKSDRALSLLMSFAAGMMLSIVFFDLLHHATESPMDIWMIALMILAGFLVVHFLHKVVEHRAAKRMKGLDSQMFLSGIVMIVVIAFHNIPVGMTIGASYLGHSLAWSSPAVTLAILVGIHNIPEGMSVSAPLLASGMSKFKTVLLTAFGGITIMIGGLLGYFIGDVSESSLAVTLSFASGAMLYITLGEMIPHAQKKCPGKLTTLFVIVGMILGMILIYS